MLDLHHGTNEPVDREPPDEPVRPAGPVVGERAAQIARARRIRRNLDWLTRALPHAPRRPGQLTMGSWRGAFLRTIRELVDDDLTDRAATLTYYGIQSLFPGLLVLVAVLGLLGPSTTESVVDSVAQLTPGTVRQILVDSMQSLQSRQSTAGALAVVGLVVAFWSASAYVGAFMRAANAIYDVPESRPMWQTLRLRIAVTVLTGSLLAASALTVVLTGRLAELVGGLVGVGPQAVRVWDVAKWPVLVVAIGILFAVLYWVAPNVRTGFSWVTPGSLLAVLVWLLASAGFAVYVAHFSSYNKTYGTIGGVIVFLVWLWLSNVALLLGAEFDAELSRSRAIEVGYPGDAVPYVQMRRPPDAEPTRPPDAEPTRETPDAETPDAEPR